MRKGRGIEDIERVNPELSEAREDIKLKVVSELRATYKCNKTNNQLTCNQLMNKLLGWYIDRPSA